MYALLLACVLVQAADADLDKKVSFHSPVKRLELLMPELEKASGVKLRVTPRTQEDLLMISVEDVRLKDLMDRIAQVDGAEWVKKPEFWALERSDELQKQLLDRDLSETVAACKKAADAQKLSLETPFDAAAAEELARELKNWDLAQEKTNPDRNAPREAPASFKKGPMARLYARVVPQLDFRAIALMPSRTSLVFSTSPNRYQKPLNLDAKVIIDEFKRENALWEEAAKARGLEQSSMQFGNDPRKSLGADVAAATKIVVFVQPADPGRGPFAHVCLLAADGRQIAGAAQVLFSPSQAEIGAVLKGQKEATGDFKLSPENEQHLRATSMRTVEPPALTPAWQERLADVTRHDYLSYGVSQFCSDYAAQLGKQLVAAPTDFSTFALDGFLTSRKLDFQSVKAGMAVLEPNAFKVDGDWLLIASKTPEWTRLRRENRHAAAALLKSLAKKGFFDIDDLSLYAAARPDDSVLPGTFGHAKALAHGAHCSLLTSDYAVLRVYGQLTPEQRRSLPAGGTLPYSQLTPSARAAMDAYIFGTSGPGASFTRQEDAAVASFEPTEMFPNGPTSLVLRMPVSATPGVAMHTRGDDVEPAWCHFLHPEDIASRNIQTGGPDAIFQPGQVLRYGWSVELAKGVSKNADLVFAAIDLRQPRVRFSQLPEAFRQLVSQYRSDPSMAQGSLKPPPP